jgi:hypothetical protein
MARIYHIPADFSTGEEEVEEVAPGCSASASNMPCLACGEARWDARKEKTVGVKTHPADARGWRYYPQIGPRTHLGDGRSLISRLARRPAAELFSRLRCLQLRMNSARVQTQLPFQVRSARPAAQEHPGAALFCPPHAKGETQWHTGY